jgi:hypothetical protein
VGFQCSCDYHEQVDFPGLYFLSHALSLSLSLSSLPSENPLNDLSGIRFDFLS